ncbi:ABC transporter substrate-binding protein [Teichococcus vastitatis]|jgi:ABC-type glycerol-3-phosphate transport system substrate-binding protein|uniref:ABC transporter substrate-binding protein n=1 Tax=Teichococcus vastitatis TaxID=2307076 RepID=A0ABS9W668_9PROT|nr:ABC transporter substrate-binding protein [Pseudoroseomonas vastitatis]MCI0754706.1 ABC transporter substrate-binding protein [Pseudoroseomonas vastitatis]
MEGNGISRRGVLRAGALGVAASTLPLVNVHGQSSGGRLALGLWDHWVPAGNDAMRKIVMDWGQKNRVEIQLDFITSVGSKNLLTIAAESQARQGHDMLSFPTWEVHSKSNLLEPLDDVMGRLQEKYGGLNPITEYLAKVEGTWRAVPAISGSQNKPAIGRFDLLKQHAGLDVQAMYPAADKAGPGADEWNWDRFLKAAESMQKAGTPFGLPVGQFPDATDWIGSLFQSFGATLVNKDGDITAKSDSVRQVLDYAKRLCAFLPNDVFSWDDASNNRALISGKSALIFNPPSAWAVAQRDAPDVAKQCWTFPAPAGSNGRFTPYLPYFWGVWSFSRNKGAAKALIEHLSQREQAQAMVAASNGYDIPPFDSMTDFDTWRTEGPPQGVVYNYPVRPHHNAKQFVACNPAPPAMAVQMYNQSIQAKMIARVSQNNESIDSAIRWAEQELEGFQRG